MTELRHHWRYWLGVVLLVGGTVAATAGLWTAFPLGIIGLYFLVSGWVERKDP